MYVNLMCYRRNCQSSFQYKKLNTCPSNSVKYNPKSAMQKISKNIFDFFHSNWMKSNSTQLYRYTIRAFHYTIKAILDNAHTRVYQKTILITKYIIQAIKLLF